MIKKPRPGTWSSRMRINVNDVFSLPTLQALYSVSADQGSPLSSEQAQMLSKKIVLDLSSDACKNRAWVDSLCNDTIIDLSYWYLHEQMAGKLRNISQ
jgi:hypothetical protein